MVASPTRWATLYPKTGKLQRSWSPTWSATAGSPAADEERTLSRLRGLRSDLIDPAIAAHRGRIVKRTGDGFPRRISQRGRRCALRDRDADRHGRTQRRSARKSPHRAPHRHPSRRRGRGGRRRSDGRRRQYRRAPRRDLPSRARFASPSKPIGRWKGRLDRAVKDLGPTQLKNIAEPIRIYSLQVRAPAAAKPAPAPAPENPPRRASRSSSCRSPTSAAARSRNISSTGSRRA